MKSPIEYRDKHFALVIVDMQKKFSNSTEGLRDSTSRHLGTVNDAVRLFRDTGNPIVYVLFDGECHGEAVDDGDSLTDGLILPTEKDAIVHKTGMNSFRDSGLDDVLRSLGCDHLLIAGMVAQHCVLATYFGAFDHDLSPYMLEGGLMATDEHNVDLVEELCRTISVSEMKENKHFGGMMTAGNYPVQD